MNRSLFRPLALLLLIGLMALSLMLACSAKDEGTGSDGDVTDGDGPDGDDPDGDDPDGDDPDGDDPDGDDPDGDETPEPIAPKVEKHGLFTVVWLAGTAYEMGYQQGELLYDLVAEAMDFVRADPLLSLIPSLAKGFGILDMALENSYQDVLDECQGLVDATEGTGFSMDYCLALNFGDVMMENLPGFRSGEGPGCSQVIATGDATPDGRLYHGRNLDWGSMNIEIIHANPVIFVRQPSDGVAHAIVGFPLNLSPYTGINAAGLAMSSNEIDPIDDSQKATTGRSHVQMQGMLLKTATSLDEARDFLTSQAHMSSELIIVSDGNSGEGAVFEMTAVNFAERGLENGLVYAANHFSHPEMEDFDAPQDIDNPDSSLMRWERLNQIAHPDGEDTLYGTLDVYGMAGLLRDRVNPRTGIAAPYDDENVDNDAGLATNGPMHFVIFDPEKRLFWVAAGKDPDNGRPYVAQQPFQCFSLGELLGYADAAPCEPAVIDYPEAAK